METCGVEAFRLPPLILHPFSSAEDSSVLVESSRASLALQGFIPKEDASSQDLDDRLVKCRYAERRMLYYIGKDLVRWMDQCAETAIASGGFGGRRIRPETFAALLTQQVPANVRAKLETWGVLDFSSLFRRAIGLHAVFHDLPPDESFTGDFLRRYHRYVDHWYQQRLQDSGCDAPKPDEFIFELYASGEYTLMLEQSWGSEAGGQASPEE